MIRVVDWVLLVVALAALALGAAAKMGRLAVAAPPVAFGVIAAICVALIAIRALPLRVRRPVVFLVTLALLAAITAGLAYFQFVIKPTLVKGFISAAFAPKPAAVWAQPATYEQWSPQLTAIGSLRAYQGIFIAPQVAGVISAIHFESGQDVKEGDLLINIDDSVEQADLLSGQAQLRNAEATLVRQKALVLGGNTPQATLDSALASRDSAAATVQRTQAIIAQKAIRAPFSGRIGIRNADLGQYAAVGTPLATLTQLDPIYADFPVTEEALATVAVGQEVTMTVGAIPGRTFTGKIKAIDARVSTEFAQRDHPRHFRQSRTPPPARHVRQLDRHHRHAGPGVDPAAHRDHLQPLWRKRLRRRAGAQAQARARQDGGGRPGVRRRSRGRASLRPARPDPRRAHRHRGRREGGRAGGRRRPDQAAGELARRPRPTSRPAVAGSDAAPMSPSAR